MQTQRRQLKKRANELGDAQEEVSGLKNRQGQAARYWHQVQALQRKLFDSDMRMRFPPDGNEKSKKNKAAPISAWLLSPGDAA